MRNFCQALTLGLAVGAISLATSGAAQADDPLGGKAPWNFQAVNRAALAIAIKQIEDPGAGGPTTIVCGGTSGSSGQGGTGSGSSATANDSCIIVSNSSGAIVQTDQDSDGDQDADASVKATTNNKNGSSGSIDEVDAILGGHKQGL